MENTNVFFTALSKNSGLKERETAVGKILESSGIEKIFTKNDKVAVKIHVGENLNNTHISPRLITPVVSVLKTSEAIPFLTETSTLYKGNRSNAVDHLIQAFDHGFTYEATGAPFIMADGLSGNSEIEVPVKGIIFDKVNIAREVVFADGIISVSHPTGHVEAGIGACIKNLGMGLSSRMGKMRQHSSIKPRIDPGLCILCGKCIKWCPENTIIEKDQKAFIIEEKCIGCGECLPVCNFNAVQYNWEVESADLQKRIAEHALGVLKEKEKKCFFINIITDITKDCDCYNLRQKRIYPDIGIAASTDPVAVDQATLDLIKRTTGKDITEESYPDLDPEIQLCHGEKIGLGNRKYNLVEI